MVVKFQVRAVRTVSVALSEQLSSPTQKRWKKVCPRLAVVSSLGLEWFQVQRS